jgi:hypothetical protein
MKIFFEDYKGQTINYDDDYDKFICDISVEDKFKTTKRSSLNDIRREIDQFIKLNLDFKPFRVLLASGYNDSQFSVAEVASIRTDRKLVVISSGGYRSYFGKEDAKKLMKFDADLMKEKEVIEDDFKKASDRRSNTLKELSKRLVTLDLSKYDLA